MARGRKGGKTTSKGKPKIQGDTKYAPKFKGRIPITGGGSK